MNRRVSVIVSCLLLSVIKETALADTSPSLSDRDMLKMTLEYNRRMLVDAYANDGTPKGPWDADAKAFLELMAVHYAQANFNPIYYEHETQANPAMAKLADGLGKCDNPLVNYCRAAIYKDSGDPETYSSLLKKWAPQIVDGHYPAYRKVFALEKLIELSPKDQALAARRDDLVVAWLAEPVKAPLERRLVYKMLTHQLWKGKGGSYVAGSKSADRQRLLDQFAANPAADPWLLAAMRGVHEVGVAWEYRGSGLANTISEKGWAGFKEHIAKARGALGAAYKLEPTYPEAASEMVTVCMAESAGLDETRKWFDLATGAQIDYFDAWSRFSAYLSPRWGGTMDQMQALAKEAADSKRFDTYLPAYAITLLAAMEQEEGAGSRIYRRPGVWDIIASGIDGYLDPPGKHVDVPLLASSRVVFAWKCGQYAEALRTLDILGEQISPQILANHDLTLDALRAECQAMTGPFAAKLRAADAKEIRYDFAGARDVFKAVLDKMQPNDRDRPYVYRRHATVALTAGLSKHEATAVPLAANEDVLAFTGDPAHWSIKDGVLRFAGPAGSQTTLLHRALLPPQTHIKLEWSYTAPPGGRGPVFGVVLQDTREQGLVSVRHFATDNRLDLSVGTFTVKQISAADGGIDFKPESWHTLEITHNGDHVTVREDGKSLIDEGTNGWAGHGTPVFGFTVQSPSAAVEVRVRNVSFEP